LKTGSTPMSQTTAAAQPISPLRRRMIEDMTVRRIGEKTQSDYIRHVKNFSLFLGRSPHTATPEDLRAFQVHQSAAGVQPPTMNGTDRNARRSPRRLALLRDWWGVGQPATWLFPGRDPLLPITTRQLYRVVREAAEAAGIKKRVSPHTLRHSFATHLLEQGVDIRVIQTLLGHAKLDTTALYTRVANTTIRAVTSPLDRLAPLIEGKPRPEV